MKDPIKIEKFQILKETEKAYLMKIGEDQKEAWIPKSKIELDSTDGSKASFFQIEKSYFEKIEYLKPGPNLKIFKACENYNENVYKMDLEIEKGTYKATKFMFFQKTKVVETTENHIIVPKWIWEKSIKELLEKECEYFNEKYQENIKPEEYNVLVDVEELN